MLALLAALALTSAACGPDPGGPPGVAVLNNTDQTIIVTYVVDGLETAITEGDGGTLQDSEMRTFRLDLFDEGNPYHWTTGDIVVRSLDGQERDRFPPYVRDRQVLRALDRRAPAE